MQVSTKLAKKEGTKCIACIPGQFTHQKCRRQYFNPDQIAKKKSKRVIKGLDPRH